MIVQLPTTRMRRLKHPGCVVSSEHQLHATDSYPCLLTETVSVPIPSLPGVAL